MFIVIFIYDIYYISFWKTFDQFIYNYDIRNKYVNVLYDVIENYSSKVLL